MMNIGEIFPTFAFFGVGFACIAETGSEKEWRKRTNLPTYLAGRPCASKIKLWDLRKTRKLRSLLRQRDHF
jgi:hypothetical protein